MNIFKKYFVQRKISIRNSYIQKRELNETEKLIHKTIIRISSNPENFILTNSDNTLYYIQTSDKNYAVILSSNMVKVSNHELFIEYSLDPYLKKLLTSTVQRCSNNKIKAIENEIAKNEKNSLNKFLNNINKQNGF